MARDEAAAVLTDDYIPTCECPYCINVRMRKPDFVVGPSAIVVDMRLIGQPVAAGMNALVEGGRWEVDAKQPPEAVDRTNPKDLLGLLKLPLRLFPAPALAYASRVFALGAKKYGAYNWRKNAVKRTVYLEAALRHILTALDGEDIDPESGQPHEAHALACMAIVLDAKATGNLIDDRFTPGVFGQLVQEMQERKAT